MKIDFLISALAALIPLIVGFIWYNPKVFGNTWMKSANLNEDKLKSGNMPLIFGLTFILSFFIAILLHTLTIHQWGVFSALMTDKNIATPGSELNTYFSNFMQKYGTNFRTFKHGALHGVLTTLFLVFPVIAINGMFERKSFKHIAINTGFWLVSLGLMGGVICKFANAVI